MNVSELWRKSAVELAGMIRDREVSSREVVQAHLDRIEVVNPGLNAIVRLLPDEALAAADEADRQSAGAEGLGSLHGVPFTVKENIDLAGTATTQAVPALAEAVAPVDAPQVERMRAAGAIPIGRTNLPDFGLRVHTDSALHGLTRNPWNPGRTAGGSSGGEAAAIATGMSPIGLGNDLGGSLRNPAHCCGIASIKPSTGSVPAATVIPPEDYPMSFQLMAVDGCLARRVADVRAGFTALAGPHPRDPLSLPVTFTDLVDGERPKVAVLPEPPGGSTHPEVAAAVRRAADALADEGFEVTETVPPDYEQALELWGSILSVDLRIAMPIMESIMGSGGRQFLGYALDYLPTQDLAGWATALTARHGLARRWSLWYQEYPVLLSPVWTQPAFPLDYDIDSAEGAVGTLELMRPVLPANLLGTPAAVVPAGLADGLPVGVQVMGARYTDLRCLAVAEIIERRLGSLTPIDPAAG
ncbi:MAG TPA: amidase [Streptosporangiaceae bacterium]|nr:amidase [Streptosporangiaceae bacterium]